MKRLGAVVLGLALLAGCPDKGGGGKDAGSGVAAGPSQLSEKEPNGRGEQAQTVGQSAIVVGSLTADPSKPDEDWYLLQPAAPQQVDVTVSGINGQDVVLSVFDQDRNPVLTVNSEGEGKGERFPNLSLVNKLYVRVSGAKKGAGGAYTMTVLYSPPVNGFEREPNDRAVDATPLQLGDQVKGFIGHSGDEDWYRIELPTAAVQEPAPAPQPDSAPAPNMPTTPSIAPTPNPTPPGEPGTPPAAGTASGGEAAQPAPGEPGTPTPPDNQPSTDPNALAATPDQAVQAQPDQVAANDADGSVPSAAIPAAPPAPTAETAAAPEPEPEQPGAALRIEASGVKGAKLQLSVLTEAEASLFDVKGNDDEGLTLRNIGVRPSDRVVYVVVKSAWSGSGKEAKRGYSTETPYTLSVSLEPEGANAEYEPNDDLAHATPLPRDGYREGFLSPKTDSDYYVLKMDQPVLATFGLSGVDRVDLALEVVRPKDGGGEETVLRANDGEVKEPEILNTVYCPAECYVKVMSASRKIDGKWVRDFENAEQPYRLTVSVIPDTGAEEREPNGAATEATPLTLGQPIRGTIQPRRDVDYYRIDLSNRLVRTSLKATLLGILKVDLGLYLHRLEDNGSLTLVQTSDRAKREQPEVIRYSAEPGIYLLEVRDSSRRYEANFQDRYQLTVQEGG